MNNKLKILIVLGVASIVFACVTLAILLPFDKSPKYVMAGDYYLENIEFNKQSFTLTDFEADEEISNPRIPVDFILTNLSSSGRAKLIDAINSFTGTQKQKLLDDLIDFGDETDGIEDDDLISGGETFDSLSDALIASFTEWLVEIFNYENYISNLALNIKYDEAKKAHTVFGSPVNSTTGKFYLNNQEYTWNKSNGQIKTTYEDVIDDNFSIFVTVTHKKGIKA